MYLLFRVLLIGSILSAPGWGAVAADPAPGQATVGPLSPREALDSFVAEPGLRVELVAAEPLVDSPVAMAFDERGRLYVAENRGYPQGPPAGEAPVGRIALLEDTDGDGRYEKRTDFATGLTFPNGVMPWRGGLIVTCAPDILYLRDNDGDGKADERTVWLTGFATTGSTQLRVSHPTLGVDNWIYVTSGLTGGNVTCPTHPERPALRFGRTDFRFRPDLSAYETCDGGGQYGLSFDDNGQRFVCYNRVQVQHVVLPSRYLRRNSHLAFADTLENCPVDVAPEPLQGHGQGARLYPLSTNVTTADSHAGTFTAACGTFVWRGGNLPAAYDGGVFSCDPTGNLVHFDRLEQCGATFRALPARPGQEFLASPDNWFRPVFLSSGPDEALYVCDMYRQTIEHPDYLPEEIRKRTDFRGRGLGRIWRIVSDQRTPQDLQRQRQLTIHNAGNSEAIAQLLKSSGSFSRDLGHRLLLESGTIDTADLRRLLQQDDLPTASKVVLLHLLAAREAADEELLLSALRDEHAAIRREALLLAEPRLAKSAALAQAVLPLAADGDPQVRFQWALTAGELADDRAVSSLVDVALRDAPDRWVRAAVFSSLAGREQTFLQGLLAQPVLMDGDGAKLYTEFGRLWGASQPPAAWSGGLRAILGADDQLERRAALIAGMADALRRAGAARRDGSVILPLLDQRADGARAPFQGLVQLASDAAVDQAAPPEQRQLAVAMLAQAGNTSAGETLLALVDPRQSTEIQSAAVRALYLLESTAVTTHLLSAERFATYTPTVREEVLAGAFANKNYLPGLLAALEQGDIPPGAIAPLRRKQLTAHDDPAIRERATKVFGVSTAAHRGAVYDDYKSVLALAPHAENGQAVFRKHCANCHRLDREGFAVGPDLFGVRNQPKEALLLHILIPEHEITQGFAAYLVETKDGRTLTGLLASETPVSVTLRQPLGKEETILRSDIEQLVSSPLSLMPQEFEKAMSRQELADLVSYLKGERPMPAASQ